MAAGTLQRGKKRLPPFAREISILEALHHRNICLLKEVFFEADGISKSHPYTTVSIMADCI